VNSDELIIMMCAVVYNGVSQQTITFTTRTFSVTRCRQDAQTQVLDYGTGGT